MRISQALILFTHLIALSGFLALSVTEVVSPFTIVVFSLSFVFSFINERYEKGYYLGSGISSLLAVLLIFYVGFNILFLGVEIVKGLLDFLIYTQILKLLGKKSTRDVMQIYLLSFFQFLAGTVLTVSFLYGVIFLFYIAVAIWAIMVYSMNKDALDQKSSRYHKDSFNNKSSWNQTSSGSQDPGVITPLFLSTTFILSFCIFIIAALIFVSVPRLKSGIFAGSFLKQRALKSGFSEEVTLGRVGEIKLDDSAVMRVHILNRDEVPVPNPLYWRGIALDHFDGTKWKSSGYGYKLHKAQGEGVFRTEETPRKPLYQEIITEPLDSNILFAAEKPVGFKAQGRKRLERINDSYMFLVRVSGRMKYFAYSDTYIPTSKMLSEDSTLYPEVIREPFLQLDHGITKLSKLAHDITKYDHNPYDKALSIKLYLLENFKYTRTLDKASVNSPLEDFLFVKKEGHCEYFATAMVILLREVGVPARIVNGFVGGEWNPHGEFYLVRESDAHSWAEVYFPSYGWVIFDATPEAESSFHDASPWFVLSYIDYIKFRWQRYVIDFNQRDQIKLLAGIEDSVKWQKHKFSSLSGIRPQFNKGSFMILALALLGLWLFVKKPSFLPVIGDNKNILSNKASLQYGRALKYLSKIGYEKPLSMTPGEYSDYVISEGGETYVLIVGITDKYLKIRFGDVKTTEELSELTQLVRELRKKCP